MAVIVIEFFCVYRSDVLTKEEAIGKLSLYLLIFWSSLGSGEEVFYKSPYRVEKVLMPKGLRYSCCTLSNFTIRTFISFYCI